MACFLRYYWCFYGILCLGLGKPFILCYNEVTT
nr:MAG TPA: putative zinc-ribbon domain protein [Caudoviricetes sp.]